MPAAGALFDDASAARLGPGAVLALADGLLSISLSPRSSLAPGDVLIVAQRPGAPALVDAASGAPFANGALAAVAASPGTPPPTATIAGPSTVGGVCPGGAVSVGGAAFDALTPEQEHQAFLSRLLLMLGSFVIMCLLLF